MADTVYRQRGWARCMDRENAEMGRPTSAQVWTTKVLMCVTIASIIHATYTLPARNFEPVAPDQEGMESCSHCLVAYSTFPKRFFFVNHSHHRLVYAAHLGMHCNEDICHRVGV